MIARRATHGVVIGVNWVEASIAVPGLIEVDAIAGLREQVLGLFGVVANTVVGTVGHNAVRRFCPALPLVSGLSLIFSAMFQAAFPAGR